MLKEEQEAKYDSLLDLVCTHPCDRELHNLALCRWPAIYGSFERYLQEESAYSSQDDFLLLAYRLDEAHEPLEFTFRQRPSRLRDLWRDRRSSLQ